MRRLASALALVGLAACAPDIAPAKGPADAPAGPSGPAADVAATPKVAAPLEAGRPIPPLPAADAVLARAVAPAPSAAAASLASLSVPGERGAKVPLRVERARVAVTVEGRLARTEVMQTFRSGLGQVSEGTYAFTLPEGAALTRLAMDVDGKMVEGELVERDVARHIYDGIVRARKDPALLEWQAGNRFTTEIFPIPAGGTKTVVIAYEELLPVDGGQLVYRYALPRIEGAAESLVGDFGFDLAVVGGGPLVVQAGSGLTVGKPAQGEGAQASLAARDFKPDRSLAVLLTPTDGLATTYAVSPPREGAGGRPARYFQLDWVPPATAAQAALPVGDLVVALDTSAGLGATELARAKALVAALAARGGGRVTLVHGDYRVATCPEGGAPACLDGLDAGGGSDLVALLEAAVAASPTAGPSAVVLVGDGVPSLGELDADLIRSRVGRALAAHPGARLHAVAVGPGADQAFLASLALLGAGHVVRLAPDRAPADVAAELDALLERPVLANVTVTVAAGQASELSPRTPAAVPMGGALPIFGRLDEGPVTLIVRGELAGTEVRETLTIDPAAARSSPLVHDFWARAALGERERAGAPRADVVAFSREHGVMSRYTSFLVLENERMFAEHGIEQRKAREAGAPAAAPDVAPATLQKTDGRLQDLLAAAPGDSASAVAEVLNGDVSAMSAKLAVAMGGEGSEFVIGSGASGMGFVGGGPGGGGDGVGRIAGMGDADAGGGVRAGIGDVARRRVGRLELGKPTVAGFCKRSNVESVVRRRAGALRACYEQRLQLAPDLRGRLTPRWTIDLEGAVASVTPQAVRLPDEETVSCILRVIRRMRFERPEGGICVVQWPLGFSPGDSGSAPALGLDAPVAPGEPSPEEKLQALVVAVEGAPKTLAEKLGQEDLDDASMVLVLRLFVVRGKPELAAQLAELWGARDGLVTRTEAALAAAGGGDAFDEVQRHLLEQIVDRGYATEDHLTRYASLVGRAGSATPEVTAAAATRLLTVCQGETHPPLACAAWLRPLADRPEVATRLRVLAEARVAELERARRDDFANPELITELASLVPPARGARLMSELVELDPHDYAARVRYAVALAEGGDVTGACDQYRLGVLANPSEREAFRAMMGLRRAHPEAADAVRRCIVEGVAGLPVRRDLSLVLIWDTDAVDVDLHVHEAGGAEVSFHQRESEAGGLLYYDVTDGFGPEVYTLGAAPAGAYRLGVVYYSGAAPKVSGTLTVIRRAGFPDESREDFPFTLKGANDTYELPLTTLTFRATKPAP